MYLYNVLPFALIAQSLLAALLCYATCPDGFVEQNNMCVQLPPTCPPNYILHNGLCYPINQRPSAPANLPTISPQPVPTPCNIATVPASQPCNFIDNNQPCSSPPPVQPCNLVASAQPCYVISSGSPLYPQPAPTPCNTATVPTSQPCNLITNYQPCNAPALPCNVITAPTQPCNAPPIPYPIYPIYPTNAPDTTPLPIVVPTIPSIREPEVPSRTTTTSTTTTPHPHLPPDPITRCPEGTILVNGVCRLIYCHKGIFKDNTCIQTVCSEGTEWTGIRCASPEPIEHSISYNHTVYTNFKYTEPDVIINNINNMVVNMSIEVPLATSNNCEDDKCDDSPPPLQTIATPLPPSPSSRPETQPPSTISPCCNVMTPRTCKQNVNSGHWNCYSKRYRQCGQMCVAPTIYLRPEQVYQPQPDIVVMPPNPMFRSCKKANSCLHNPNIHDCSGCIAGFAETCSPYCYNYRCGHRRCHFYDQRDYCTMLNHNGIGGSGCKENDGCYDDWCNEFKKK